MTSIGHNQDFLFKVFIMVVVTDFLLLNIFYLVECMLPRDDIFVNGYSSSNKKRCIICIQASCDYLLGTKVYHSLQLVITFIVAETWVNNKSAVNNIK